MASCVKCNKVVKKGVICIKCNASFHRGCEKLKGKKVINNYVCIKCNELRQITDGENDSDCDSNTSIDSFFESSMANVAAENERLICENKSLMEIIKRLQDDVAVAEKTISVLNIENTELRNQLDLSKEFVVVTSKNRNSPPTVLTNRFQPLAKDFPPLPKTKALTLKNNPRPKQSKPQRQVLVIGDSHARGCSSILKEKLGGEFSVSGIVKPNARLSDVVRDVDQLAANFNKNDHIIVFGGTNDLGQYNPHQYTIRKGLQALSSIATKTNITVSSIPQRHDIPSMNSVINNINTTIKQGSIYDWVLDHRLHHKYFGTDVDPYNNKKGLLHAHITTNLKKKHPEYTRLAATIDMSDLQADSVVMFQDRYYWILVAIVAVLLPWNAPVEYWSEHILNALILVCFLRCTIALHWALLINSGVHLWGIAPGDKSHTNSNLVFVLTKSYWPQYHYLLPWDYQTGEYGNYGQGCTSTFIRIWAAMGWATGLRTMDTESIRNALVTATETKKPVLDCLCDAENYSKIYNEKELYLEPKHSL